MWMMTIYYKNMKFWFCWYRDGSNWDRVHFSVVRNFCLKWNGMFFPYWLAGSWVVGWEAIKSKAFCMAIGIGGGVGIWSPCGWKPFSSAIKENFITWPSGAVYSTFPCATWISSSSLPAFFRNPCSSALIPLPVSYLETEN